jgi:four helix bundle protein
MSSSFRDLRVWQQAMDFTVQIYRATDSFPKPEVYGLSQQMRRAAISVPSNIAEGKGYSSDKDFRRFLFHARGSLMEVETQILIAARLQYLSEEEAQGLQTSASQVARSLAGLLNAINGAI